MLWSVEVNFLLAHLAVQGTPGCSRSHRLVSILLYWNTSILKFRLAFPCCKKGPLCDPSVWSFGDESFYSTQSFVAMWLLRAVMRFSVTARVHKLIFLSRATWNQQIYHLRGKKYFALLWRSNFSASFCTLVPMSEEMEGKYRFI